MAKNIYITESQLKHICENNGLVLEHETVVDNMADAEKMIRQQWSSPDDFWFVQITQRKKDFRSYNARHGKISKWWNRDPSVDGTGRENFAGYGVVKGKTADDAVDSLKNITIKLNPWAEKLVGSKSVSSQGNAEAVYAVCDKLYARAYITINKRSMNWVQARIQNRIANGVLRAFEIESSRLHDNPRDEQYYPWVMIDMDIDNPQAWAEMDKYLASQGFNPSIVHKSHDGIHYFFNSPKIANAMVKFQQFNKYATNNRPGDPPVLIKRDAKMILYSPCGQ